MKSQSKSIEHNPNTTETWYAVLNSNGYITYISRSESDAREIAEIHDEVIPLVRANVKSV